MGGSSEDVGEEAILAHYAREAETHGLDPSSTMADMTTRRREVEALLAGVARAVAGGASSMLEVGCGNGHLLELIRERHEDLALTGIDYTPEMVSLANSRAIDSCRVERMDVRDLDLPSETFDVVVSERCIINLLDEDSQARALHELARVLRPDGLCLLLEAFTDGHENLNRARSELGLDDLSVPFHNRWLDKDWFMSTIEGLLDDAPIDEQIPPHNFLSSHYFISRVLYPATTSREILYNTEFVRFFGFLPPIGNYAAIQLFALRRRP